MAMLAEPRRKQKVINLRAKNSAWSNDANKFGQRMLEKMGWAPGKGLGAKENGIVEHVIAKYKNDERGLGFEDKNDQWTKHEDDFNSLLANLSNAEGDDKLISGVSLEDKSKKSKARVHYHKFTRGKDISRYSKKDLANIFGKKSFDVKKETEENSQEDFKITEKVFTEKGSMHDYFKSKLAAFKSKPKTPVLNNSQNLDDEANYAFQGFSNADIIEDRNLLNESVGFQPFLFVNPNSNTNKEVEPDQSSENLNVKKSKKSKKDKGDCDEKEHVKKTKRKKRKNVEINEFYSKSNENELTDQIMLRVEEHDVNEVPKKKKKKKNHLHNTENLEQNKFIENKVVTNAEIVNLMENDIHYSDQICPIPPKKKKSKIKESQDTICESVEEHVIYKKKKKKKEKSLKGTTVVGIKENCEVPEELLVTNNHVQQKSKFKMPKQRKNKNSKVLSESDETSSEQSITNKKRNNRLLSNENIQDNIKSDIQELKSIYAKCKTVVGNIETKYCHLMDTVSLPSGKRSKFSSLETDSDNDECNCFLNTRIVYGEDGKSVTQEPRKDNHICAKKLKKQHENALIPNANHCNISPLWVKNEENVQGVDASGVVFQLPNDLLTLETILRDPDIVDENYRNIVLAKVNSLKKEFRDEIRREKNDLIKAAKEDADSVFHFTGSNLSTVAIDSFY